MHVYRSLRRLVFASLFALLSPGLGLAQDDFDDLPLRGIGPAVMGGRIDAVVAVPREPGTLYVGAASGGLWKSTNMGTTWAPIFDDQATSSIGDIAVSPLDPQTVWVGTGEPNNRQSSTFGYGVYRSDDGGRRWRHMGLEETGHIGSVILHPTRPERVYVAAVGPLWRSGTERGVFRTSDGGTSWEKVLYVDENTGATALVMDPLNPNLLYAATYQRRRVPWGFAGGGPGSGLYRSADGGDTWTRLESGLPQGALGRIGLAVARSAPGVLYALVEHGSEGGVYRSADRGSSWTRVNELNPRPMYYSKIFVDPSDSERIYVLGSSFHSSANGGKEFTTNDEMTPTYDVGVHGDHHTLWIDPNNGKHLVLGGDGGLYVSWDGAATWRKVDNLPLAQFYAVAVDMETPYNIYGGAQDTHSWMGPSATRNQIGILNGDWRQTNFGDGMYQQADPTDDSVAYTESQGGNLLRLDRRTGDRRAIKPFPEDDEDEYRFHWTSPFLVSIHDASTLYLGGNRLFVSRDRGENWASSQDLTRNEDRDELPIMGAIPDDETLSRHDGVAVWGSITTIAESPLSAGTLYVGTDDGRVQLTRDDGTSWQSLESGIPRLDPNRVKVSRIVASAHSTARAYVSFDRHHLGDDAPYLFVTEDFGESFRALTLPEDARWVNVVVEHPDNEAVLFVGTETGLFLSFDRGTRWLRVRGGLPTVPVDDLLIHPREHDLVVGTHGRSIFVLDDASPLAAYRPDRDEVQLFEPRDTTLFLPWKHESYGAQAQFVGANPPYGALLTYHLPGPAEDAPRLVITDGEGNAVRHLTGVARQGFNRVVWDLRTDPPEGVSRGRGVRVAPGVYTVSLDVSAGARSQTMRTELRVLLDPRAAVEEADVKARAEYLVAVNRLRERMQAAVERGGRVMTKAEELRELFQDASDAPIVDALEQLTEDVSSVRTPLGGGPSSFRSPNLLARAAQLFDELAGDDVRQGTLHPPTPVQRRRFEALSLEADERMEELDETVSRRVSEVNEALAAHGPIRLLGS